MGFVYEKFEQMFLLLRSQGGPKCICTGGEEGSNLAAPHCLAMTHHLKLRIMQSSWGVPASLCVLCRGTSFMSAWKTGNGSLEGAQKLCALIQPFFQYYISNIPTRRTCRSAMGIRQPCLWGNDVIFIDLIVAV